MFGPPGGLGARVSQCVEFVVVNVDAARVRRGGYWGKKSGSGGGIEVQ